MELEVEIKMEYKSAEGNLEIEFLGEDMGILIGKRGQTLDSLQYLTSLVVNKGRQGYIRVKLDTEDYRNRRKETLENLAKSIAYKVRKTRKPVSLEPMNPYERRIIHTTVQKVNGAISWSEGEDMGRHVVIGPDPKVKQSFRPRREGGRPRNNNFRSRSQSQDGTKGEAAAGAGTQPRPEIKKNAAAYEKIVPGIPAQPKPVQEKKPVKDESPVSPLYGKIEPKKGE